MRGIGAAVLGEAASPASGVLSRALAAVGHVSRLAGLASGQLYFLCALITTYEVVMRYAFNSPTQWAFEIVMTLCATAWLLSSGYVTLGRRHIGITVFLQMAPESAQRRIRFFSQCAGFLALYLLAESSLDPALLAVRQMERSGSGFNPPMPMILKMTLVLGALLYLSQLTANLLQDARLKIVRAAILTVAALCVFRLAALTIEFYAGENPIVAANSALFSVLSPLGDFGRTIDIRSYGIGAATVGIVVLMLALMATGMPLGVVTLVVSIGCAILFFGPRGLFLVSANVYGLLEKYPLVAVPLFVLMGSILERSGIARDLFDAMAVVGGNLRGGVAVQTTAVALVLAAMTGIMGGEIVMLGLVALPQMIRLGYDRKLAMGVICASGSLATLIPPSIVMIVYALAAQVSIGSLFLAGVAPGLILGGFYILYILIICRLRPQLAPVARESLCAEERRLSPERLAAVSAALALIALVMGSIYAGVASVTESAGVGVIGAMLVAKIRRKLDWEMVQGAVKQTMATVGTIIWLVLGAVSLIGIYNVIGGNSFMRGLFTGLDIHPLGVILLMMGVLVILGTFMEWIAIVFITVPIFAPVVVGLAPALGMDPSWAAVWFGVLFVMNMQIYFLSPPFGPACFWLKSVAPKDVTLQEIYLSVLPFIALQIIGVALIVFFPEIALFLPKALSG